MSLIRAIKLILESVRDHEKDYENMLAPALVSLANISNMGFKIAVSLASRQLISLLLQIAKVVWIKLKEFLNQAPF